MIQILYNPQCSKSNCALAYLKEENIQFEVLNYLHKPLMVNEIQTILQQIGIPAAALIRKSEPLYKEKYAEKSFSEQEWIEIMAENPILIERPIIIKDNKAVIGRPIEKVYALLNDESISKEK